MLDEIRNSLNLKGSIETTQREHFTSCFSVSELAANSMASVGCALAQLKYELNLSSKIEKTNINQRLASLWFSSSIKPVSWSLPPVWDEISGDYQTRTGWIKLHCNLSHHKNAVLSVLGVEPEKEILKKAALNWCGHALEKEIINAQGAAAAIRTLKEWSQHPQGKSVKAEPLIHFKVENKGRINTWKPSIEKPLKGLRVLDLTRVLAGPVATRTLAGFGADILRIDPPNWEEPNVVPDITLGKRCAFLDLTSTTDRKVFEELIASSNILIHGYRADALENLGYGSKQRRQLNTNLIDISLNAYGWTGPWLNRRGFDSLVQMSSGIVHQGMQWKSDEKPVPLPVQALDHATGYFAAAATIKSITNAITDNTIYSAKLSLARTAHLLTMNTRTTLGTLSKTPEPSDFSSLVEMTPWGQAQRLKPAIQVGETQLGWNSPACTLGSSDPYWIT